MSRSESHGALGRYIGHERLEDVDGLFHAGQILAPAEHDGPGQALLRCVGLGALGSEQLEGLLPGAGPSRSDPKARWRALARRPVRWGCG